MQIRFQPSFGGRNFEVSERLQKLHRVYPFRTLRLDWQYARGYVRQVFCQVSFAKFRLWLRSAAQRVQFLGSLACRPASYLGFQSGVAYQSVFLAQAN